MGLLDGLTSALGSALGQAGEGAIPSILQSVLGGSEGGLGGILSQLQSGGLGEQVKSWLGSGANLPISADSLKSILSEEQIASISNAIGVSPDTVLSQISAHLPGLIDKLSPNGQLET